MKFPSSFLATAAFCAAPLAAQTVASDRRDELHREPDAQIVVTAPFVRDLDLLAGTSVLTGTELIADLRPQIGDTLVALPGVSATSFTPGASRPVLRGLQGERVRVLTDGIGAIDASNTSVDHAVTIDPLTAQRVEVLRGPAALLFGSQAIGGAVNVIDRRIPRVVPDEAVHIDALAGYGSAADERSFAGSVDVPVTSRFVVHADGSYRNTDDLEVGGFVLSPNLRAEQLAIAEEETEEGNLDEAAEAAELAGLRGRIPNTATESYTAGVGAAYIDDWGNLGVSVSYYDTVYGIPARPGAGHHHEEGEGDEGGGEEEEEGEAPVSIDMEQLRADFRGEIRVGGDFIESIRVRAGVSDYEHTEFEGEEIGTLFFVEGIEGRLELVQADRDGWRGVIGSQFYARDFESIGAEAFIPRNDTVQYGVFTLQEFDIGRLGIELAGRYERTEVGAPPLGVDRSFDAFSGAVGASYGLSEGVRLGANLSRAERAPSAEELFADGPHIATQSFEIGDPDLDTEKSIGLEGYVRGEAGPVSFALTGYANWFDDFIFETGTGEEEDELPVFQFFQRDARFYGFEAEVSARLFDTGGFGINVDGVADYVRATIDEGGPVPRIPPLRLLGGIEAQSENVDGRVEVEWVAEQNRTAAFETSTDDFTLVNASLAWRPFGRDNPTALIASVNNIFDVDARRHASFTKDFVPLAGRDFRVSARLSF